MVIISPLVSLFCFLGNANGNVGAFTQTGGQNTWPDSEYGLISKSGIVFCFQ